MEAIGRRFAEFTIGVITVIVISGMTQSCAPRPVYRAPVAPQPPLVERAKPQTLPPEAPPGPAQETARKQFPPESRIAEQDLDVKRPPVPGVEERHGITEAPGTVAEPALPPLVPDDSSLLAKITPNTDPRRAASLRLTDEGRKLLDAGSPAKALNRLERTIVIDSTNPYGYFYLAKAQHQLGHYQESLNFLDVAESRLSSSDRFWLAEVYALRGENYRGLGLADKAQSNYLHSLSLNAGNRTASEGLERAQSESPSGAD